MKVLEVKNNLVKIAYDVEDNLALSGFVIIEDTNFPYVAQVMNLKTDVTGNFAIVKLLFTFDEEGVLKNYNGTIPSLKASVSVLPSNELLDIIPVEYPLILGKLAQQDVALKIDRSILENNLLVCVNNIENISLLLDNFVKQLDDKVIIWDCDGQFASNDKLIFGRDFRLPLNYDTINFIYDNELEDVDATSRAIIQDIFIEVQEYIKTLPEKFLPFETFLNVVDQQYKETQVTQLVLLKNKLLKYKEMNVFAEELKDIMNLNIAIDNPDYSVLDISNVPAILQKEIISVVYKNLETQNSKIYSFVKVDNSNSDKKLLKKLLQKENIYTTIICSHEYKYILELKENAQNIIFFAPMTLQHDFASYNSFLNKLNANEFIVYGAHTQNIPFVLELSELDNLEEETLEEQIEDEVEDTGSIENILEDEEIDSDEENIDNNVDVIDSYENIEQEILEEPVLENEIALEDELITEDSSIEENQEDEPTEENYTLDNIEDVVSDDKTIWTEDVVSEDLSDESEYIEEPIIDENSDYSAIYEDTEDIETDDNEVELLQQENTSLEKTNEEMVEQAVKDVDKVLYEKLPSDEDISFEEPELLGDELTEDDLNLIDNFNLENSNEDEYAEPVVPIYESENLETSQTFEPGERVSTAKFGEGVVEGMIKYGNKMLCYIIFPEIGKRLIDPAVTEITKLD